MRSEYFAYLSAPDELIFGSVQCLSINWAGAFGEAQVVYFGYQPTHRAGDDDDDSDDIPPDLIWDIDSASVASGVVWDSGSLQDHDDFTFNFENIVVLHHEFDPLTFDLFG